MNAVSWPGLRPLVLGLAVTIGAVTLGSGGIASARPAPDDFSDLAERLLPAVVNVSTLQTLNDKDGPPEVEPSQIPPGTPFDDFFRKFHGKGEGGKGDGRSHRVTSLGSGFIIDPAGYIVTNNHVVNNADEVTVTLHDGTDLKAIIIGRDSKTDLAVLKVNAKRALPSVPWGNSDGARVGQWVLVIGNPFGLGGTVTAGIISARARNIDSGPYDDYLQTDASINRGNSGGPMFNMRGEVIGISTAIFSPSGSSVGIGFAIPSSTAKPVVAQLLKYGKPRRGWLGLQVQSVTEEIADSLGLEAPRGALVASVTPDGPAAKAGVLPGDVILRIGDKEIDDMRRLPLAAAETDIGSRIPITLWRHGNSLTVTATVGEMEETDHAAAGAGKPPAPAPGDVLVLGMSLAAVSPELRDRFELGKDAGGVVVVDIDPGSQAAEKGVKAGDLIEEVAQTQVSSPTDVQAKVAEAKAGGKKTVLFLLQADGGLRFVALKAD